MLYSRISSGLDFLDASYGGLYSNRSYLLRGPARSGRTTVCLQFLLAGLENGENAMMISSDRIENVILKAEAVGISLENYLLDNRLVLMEYPKEILSGKFQYGSIINLLGEIERYIQQYGCSRIAYDSLLPLIANPREAHLVNYIYSLVNSLEAMNVTTFVTTGEPNSPNAMRIIQLIEDAVVGSFSLSNIPSKKGQQRLFSVQKMIDQVVPPTSFKVRIDYGAGVIQDIPSLDVKKEKEVAKREGTSISEIPLHIALVDNDDDTVAEIEEIFHSRSTVSPFGSEQELLRDLSQVDVDIVIINSNTPGLNWRNLISELRKLLPLLPIFLISERRTPNLTYQSAKQAGANGLFLKPISPEDLVKALEKTLKGFGTLQELIEKRSASLHPQTLPDDLLESDLQFSQSDDGGDVKVDLLSPQAFREIIHRQVMISSQRQTGFSLVSFKMIYTSDIAVNSNIPQGLEMVKKVARVAYTSMRGLNDRVSRYMDKVVVLLDDSEKEGARAFAKRVINETKAELSTKLNLQIGKHLNILTAIVSYPEDGDNVQDLLPQVTDVSRNFVKSINI